MSAPVEISDAVELWARKSGRHATIEWANQIGCWVIRISYPPDAEPLRAWQEGLVDEEPREIIYLWTWDPKEKRYIPDSLDEIGLGGVVEMLEKADMWSGRGEYSSIADAVEAHIGRTRALREENRKKVREMGEAMGDLTRRKMLGLPLVNVPADVVPTTAPEEK